MSQILVTLQGVWQDSSLVNSPLFALTLTLTLSAYYLARRIHQLCGGHPLANPVLISLAIVLGALALFDIDYHRYFDGVRFLHFLLGTATVALAVPLYRQLQQLRRAALAISASILAGSVTASASAVLIAKSLGASDAILLSLAPKSVTTPVAMAIAEKMGGLPSLAAVSVIVTGIIGAITANAITKWLGIRDERALGLAMGVAAHGIGTARAFQLSPKIGAYSGLAMRLNALLTAVLIPILWPLLNR
jgi:predicted murein hydrolase (TIGR00659 family)